MTAAASVPAAVDPWLTNRVGRCLAAAARVVHDQRAVVAVDPLLQELCTEMSGLFDCLDGTFRTNPEQRAEAHLQRIVELAGRLPVTDLSVAGETRGEALR